MRTYWKVLHHGDFKCRRPMWQPSYIELKYSGNLGDIVAENKFSTSPSTEMREQKRLGIKTQDKGITRLWHLRFKFKWKIRIPPLNCMSVQNATGKYNRCFYITLTLMNMSYTWEIASFMEGLASQEGLQLSVNLVHWRSDKISSEQETMIFDIRFLLDKLLSGTPQIARRLVEIRSMHSRCPLSDVLSVWTPIVLISLHIVLLGSKWAFSYSTRNISCKFPAEYDKIGCKINKGVLPPQKILQMYLSLFIKLNRQ